MALFKKKEKKVDQPEAKAVVADVGIAHALSSSPSTMTSGALQATKILIKPLVTEKAATISALRQYVFAVAPSANKSEIKKAVRALYGVEPTSVNVARVSGKQGRFGRSLGQRKNWKKAIVTLKEGQSISLYEGV